MLEIISEKFALKYWEIILDNFFCELFTLKTFFVLLCCIFLSKIRVQRKRSFNMKTNEKFFNVFLWCYSLTWRLWKFHGELGGAAMCLFAASAASTRANSNSILVRADLTNHCLLLRREPLHSIDTVLAPKKKEKKKHTLPQVTRKQFFVRNTQAYEGLFFLPRWSKQLTNLLTAYWYGTLRLDCS